MLTGRISSLPLPKWPAVAERRPRDGGEALERDKVGVTRRQEGGNTCRRRRERERGDSDEIVRVTCEDTDAGRQVCPATRRALGRFGGCRLWPEAETRLASSQRTRRPVYRLLA